MAGVQNPDMQANVRNQPTRPSRSESTTPPKAPMLRATLRQVMLKATLQLAMLSEQSLAKTNDPNLVVTPFTEKGGFVGTKIFNRTTEETEIPRDTKGSQHRIDSRNSTKLWISQAKIKVEHPALPVLPENKRSADYQTEAVNGVTTTSVTVVSAKGDSFKTTNFDSNGNKTLIKACDSSGSTTTIKYEGCTGQEGGNPGCHIVSAVDKITQDRQDDHNHL